MELSQVADTLRAMAHPQRLKVLGFLSTAQNGLAAGEIAEKLRSSKSTTSGQLGILLRAGLVLQDRQGRHLIYKSDKTAITNVMNKLADATQAKRGGANAKRNT